MVRFGALAPAACSVRGAPTDLAHGCRQSTRVVFTDLERQALARLRDGHSRPSQNEVVAA